MEYKALMERLDEYLDILKKKQLAYDTNLNKNVLIMNGEVMSRMGSGLMTEKIFKLIEFCEVVLCCRCSPR